MTYLVNKANYANALPSILTDFMMECMFDMAHPALPLQGLSPIAAATPEAAEITEDVYVLRGLGGANQLLMNNFNGFLTGNEDPGNFFT